MRMIAHMTRLNAVQKLLRTDFIADPWAAAAAAFHGACPRAVLLARAPLRVPTRDLASVLKASHQGADLGRATMQCTPADTCASGVGS